MFRNSHSLYRQAFIRKTRAAKADANRTQTRGLHPYMRTKISPSEFFVLKSEKDA